MIYQNQNFNYHSSDFLEEKIYSELEKNYDNIQKLLDIIKARFQIINEVFPQKDYSQNSEISILNKSRGRPKKNDETKNFQIHSKMSFDNICQKLKVLYHCFLINLCNDFIKSSYKGFQKYRIRKVSSSMTQNVTKKYNQKLSNWNLKEFFSHKISTKYKRLSENKNAENIKKLCFFKPNLKNLFMMNYFDVYKNFFIYGNREELKIQFGISEKTLLLNDYLKKISQKESEEYVKKMESVAKGRFMVLLEKGKEIEHFNNNSSIDNNQYLKKIKIE